MALTSSYDRLLSTVLSDGILKTNLFEVYFLIPPSLQGIFNSFTTIFGANELTLYNRYKLSLLCKSVSWPNVTINTIDSYHDNRTRAIAVGRDYDSVQMNFLLDSAGTAMTFAEACLYSIQDQDTFLLNYKSDYQFDIIIMSRKPDMTTAFSIELNNAFLVNKGNVEYSYDNNTPSTIALSFSYDTYKYRGSAASF